MIPGATVTTLEIRLRDVEPPVWRRVVLPSDTPLAALAGVLQTAMGWQGYNPRYLFDVAGLVFGRPDEDEFVIDEACVVLKQLLPRVGAGLRWDWDFAEGWEHDVTVVAIGAPERGLRYPVCAAGEGGCPPERVGGPAGWAGRPATPGFTPPVFDVAATTRRLQGRFG